MTDLETYLSDIDDEPTAGSQNLVTSGGVKDEIDNVDKKVKIEGGISDLSFSDAEEHDIVQFRDGHIITKNFNSKDIASNIPDNSLRKEKLNFAALESTDDEKIEADLCFVDKSDFKLAEFSEGHIRTKNFNSRNILENIPDNSLGKEKLDFEPLDAREFQPSDYYHKGSSPKSYNTEKKLCIIVGGQSNADGRNSLDSIPQYISSALPITNCLFYGNGKSSNFIQLDYNNQTHITTWAFDLPTIYNITRNTDMYVIKTSRGSTSIDPSGDGNGYHWTPDYEQLSDISKSMLLNFDKTIRTAFSLSNEFEIRAMLWHQGEGDSISDTAIKNYYKNLKNVIAYIRGVVGNERLPFISGTISHNSIQYNSTIEEAQLRIASEDPYVTYIDMSGATLLSDNLHFDADASEYLGKMTYDVLINYGVITGTKIEPVAPWD